MASLAAWESELQKLRGDLGVVRPMLITWVPRREPRLRYPLIAYAWSRLRQEEEQIQRWDVAVYPRGAAPGTPPVLLVSVAADVPWPVVQPVEVEMAGRMEPGAAVAFRLPRGDVVFGTTPARQPGLVRRHRL